MQEFLGMGSYGVVWGVRNRADGVEYAMKLSKEPLRAVTGDEGYFRKERRDTGCGSRCPERERQLREVRTANVATHARPITTMFAVYICSRRGACAVFDTRSVKWRCASWMRFIVILWCLVRET